MRKEITFGKILGIIFCVLAAAGTVVLLFVNAYFGGQMKLIDKYYTALERDDFEGYKACVVEYVLISPSPGVTTKEAVGEKLFEFEKRQAAALLPYSLPDSVKFHVKASFAERIKITDEYAVMVDLTVYDDDYCTTVENVEMRIVRENGKWLIYPYVPEDLFYEPLPSNF